MVTGTCGMWIWVRLFLYHPLYTLGFVHSETRHRLLNHVGLRLREGLLDG